MAGPAGAARRDVHIDHGRRLDLDIDALTSIDVPALQNASNMLHLLSHRNRNQHRRSGWWRELGMLRRGVRRVLDVVIQKNQGTKGGQAGAEQNGRPKDHQTSKTKKGQAKNPARPTRQSGIDVDFDTRRDGSNSQTAHLDVERSRRLRIEARFVRGQLVPRCFLAFTALVADNQYAPLGLMLLATLARTDRILGAVVQAEGTRGVVPTRNVHGLASQLGDVLGPGRTAGLEGELSRDSREVAGEKKEESVRVESTDELGRRAEAGAEDVGVVVCREDFLDAQSSRRAEPELNISTGAGGSPDGNGMVGSVADEEEMLEEDEFMGFDDAIMDTPDRESLLHLQGRGETHSRLDADPARGPGFVESSARAARTSPPLKAAAEKVRHSTTKKDKPKKKRKGGDVFDDLFSGLI